MYIFLWYYYDMAHNSIRLNKIFVCDFTHTFDGDRAEVVAVRALSCDGKIRRDWASLDDAFHGLNNLGAVYVFVWDMSFFGCFCDYYALSHGMKDAKNAERTNTYGRVNEECFSVLYAAARGVTNFRLTLRRTAKTHNYGSGATGSLHTVEYRGLNAFFQGMKRDDVIDKCGGGDGVDGLLNVFRVFHRVYTRLSGEEILTRPYMSKVYTIGGAARRKYLKIRYNSDSLRAYHKKHDQMEIMDEYMRDRRLLLSGACFFPENNAGKLYEIPLKKYDVNSLYTATADGAGELGYPEESDFEHFIRDRSGEYAYIIIVRDFVAYKKKGAAPVFQSPFPTCQGGAYIEINEQFALFRELWETLHKFYLFEDFEVLRVFRCKKSPDPSMIEYNAFFENEKIAADAAGDEMLRKIAKLFMNNIIGKMVQKTKYIPIYPKYNAKLDIVEFMRGEIVDNWERGHFDFIRGAYIYTLARVRVMNDIYNIIGKDSESHHFYTDTDSVVTDIEFPDDIVDPRKIGFYKIEREYAYFGVIGKKIYYGHSDAYGGELTCAGIPKGLCLDVISENYGALSPPEVFQVLGMDIKYSVPRAERVRGGAAIICVDVRISEMKDKEAL